MGRINGKEIFEDAKGWSRNLLLTSNVAGPKVSGACR